MITIISSGESGVAEAAVQAAKGFKIPIDGFCLPNGCNSNDRPVSKWYGLKRADPDGKYYPPVDTRALSLWNVRKATHLLILYKGYTHHGDGELFNNASLCAKYGFTAFVANNVAYEERIPTVAVDLTDPKDILKVRTWVEENPSARIMIAGPNEFENPGIAMVALKTIRAFFKLFVAKDQSSVDPSPKEASTSPIKPSIVVGKPRPV